MLSFSPPHQIMYKDFVCMCFFTQGNKRCALFSLLFRKINLHINILYSVLPSDDPLKTSLWPISGPDPKFGKGWFMHLHLDFNYFLQLQSLILVCYCCIVFSFRFLNVSKYTGYVYLCTKLAASKSPLQGLIKYFWIELNLDCGFLIIAEGQRGKYKPHTM